jgi:hypothetical protein
MSSEAAVVQLESNSDTIARRVGETASRDFKRALIVAQARAIMEQAGVIGIDSGESIGQKIWRRIMGRKPSHVQTQPFRLLGPEETEDSPGQRWVIGERQETYEDHTTRNHRVGVAYLRPLLDPQHDHERFVDMDLAISDDGYRNYNTHDGDWDGNAVDGTKRPHGRYSDYVGAFGRILLKIAEVEDITMPDPASFAYHYQHGEA